MHHRIYMQPFTRINEAWNFNPLLDSSPNNHYRDHRIKGSANDFRSNGILCDFYKNFAIDIVTETVFHYPYPQITEKTIRPIANKRMFIIVGAPNTLHWLQSHGFKTFHPLINEDYDSITDSNDRIQFILNEIDRIAKIPIDKIKEEMLKYTDNLEHNFKLLQTLPDIDFIKFKKLFCD
jgi:hypothetical protein